MVISLNPKRKSGWRISVVDKTNNPWNWARKDPVTIGAIGCRNFR
jgi:hypothetical protein